jgi:hypothetical protein
MYKVISYFTDLQDFNHPYKVGDSFPRLGLKVTDARLQELAGSNNKQGKPLIVKVEEPKKVEPKVEVVEDVKAEYTKTEINRMSTAELKEIAKLNGVEDAENMTGGELKKVLIKKFNL